MKNNKSEDLKTNSHAKDVQSFNLLENVEKSMREKIQRTAIPSNKEHSPGKQHKPLKQRRHLTKEEQLQRRQENSDVLNWLEQSFPKCFTLKNQKPLKIRIFQDIIHTDKEGLPSSTALRRALTAYTHKLSYHQAIVYQIDRINLQGEAEGKITDEQKAFSTEHIKRIENKRKARIRKENFHMPSQETVLHSSIDK